MLSGGDRHSLVAIVLVGGVAIGVNVKATMLVGGPLTGAAMNPARPFEPALAANLRDCNLVYLVGPLCGAVLADPICGWYPMDEERNASTA